MIAYIRLCHAPAADSLMYDNFFELLPQSLEVTHGLARVDCASGYARPP